MKFNVRVAQNQHSDIATSVAWNVDNQLFSCSDDKTICKWTADGEAAGKIESVQSYITNISCFPGTGKQVSRTHKFSFGHAVEAFIHLSTCSL